jgi:hypothetical protein
MKTTLSFTPTYHELVEIEGKLSWVPMYNPIRDCVREECQRILGEAVMVNSWAWKRPEVRRPVFVSLESPWVSLLLFVVTAAGSCWLLTALDTIGPWFREHYFVAVAVSVLLALETVGERWVREMGLPPARS